MEVGNTEYSTVWIDGLGIYDGVTTTGVGKSAKIGCGDTEHTSQH